MAKRKRSRRADGWKKLNYGHDNAYKELLLSAALYLSFSSVGVVSAGWRVRREYKKGGPNPMVEFGTQKMTLDEAKAHVVRNYDKLIQQLDDKVSYYEKKAAERKAKIAAKMD